MKEYVSPLTFADQIVVGMSQIMENSIDPSKNPTDESVKQQFGPNAPKIV